MFFKDKLKLVKLPVDINEPQLQLLNTLDCGDGGADDGEVYYR